MDQPKLRTSDARVSALGVAKHTLTAIENGEFLPGAPLREQALADRFGCSRAPVREALRILESQGIVTIEPMRGARVATLREASFYEVFLIRRALAGVVVQLACLSDNADARRRFSEAVDRCDRLAVEHAPIDGFHEAVRDAIRTLGHLATADRTSQLIRGLTFGREAFQAATFTTEQRRLETAAGWKAMWSAIEQKDIAGAIAAMNQLYDKAYDFVERGSISQDADRKRKPRASKKTSVPKSTVE